MSSSTWPSLELETKQLSGENMSHSIHKVFKEFLSSTISDYQSYFSVELGHEFDNFRNQLLFFYSSNEL